MVSINYSAREVCCKIVYYGPGLSGKTTNLQYVHSKVPGNTRGDLISLATEADRTLYFDFLPINIGTINGFAAKFQLYTVPGQVYYNATRKLVLRGVDGVVFVADSQTDKMDENIESLANLEDNLQEYGYDLDNLPMVIQYNKRDLPNVLSVEQLNQQLNQKGRPIFEASATVGNGVFDTLKLIIKIVLDKAKTTGEQKSTQDSSKVGTAAPIQAPAPPPPAVEKTETVEAVDIPQPDEQEKETPTEQPLVASEPVVAPEPVLAGTQKEKTETASYRPYPGSETSDVRDTKISSSNIPVTPPQVSEKTGIEQKIISSEDNSDQVLRTGQSPLMAPSIRNRSESKKKKRGFFKRLFGIK
jgi:mutual gliding-motility protein MglA